MKNFLKIIGKGVLFLFAGLFALLFLIMVFSIVGNRWQVSKVEKICALYHRGESFSVQAFSKKHGNELESISVEYFDSQDPNLKTNKISITKNRIFDFSVLPPDNQIAGTVSFTLGFPMHGSCQIKFGDGKVSDAKQFNYD